MNHGSGSSPAHALATRPLERPRPGAQQAMWDAARRAASADRAAPDDTAAMVSPSGPAQ